MSALREFIRSGANVFGFPDDYVPFYNAGETDTFEAVRSLVVGSGPFSPQSAGGIFATARETETVAVITYEKILDTKDRIRNELFTINEQAENRLVQICGRVRDNAPSFDVNDPIDYDMIASPRNLACEIGQNAALLQKAQASLQYANADIVQFIQDIEIQKRNLADAVALKSHIPAIIAQYSALQANVDREIGEINAEQTRWNATAQAATTLLEGTNVFGWFTGESWSVYARAGIQLANGMHQADLEEQKGELQAKKTALASEERIRLTEIDTELFKDQETKVIEQKINDVVLKHITTQMAAIDVGLAMGQLNKLVVERDELLARRGRALANLGEMSFADPSFRLTQLNSMKDAETQLEFLKRWLYLMTRALYYKWALQDDYVIRVDGLEPVSIHDIRRLQVVGALNNGITTKEPLADTLSAAEYVQALLAFSDKGPMGFIVSPVEINRLNSNNSARYSLREDFLRMVRTANTAAETQRVREAFRKWITSPDRLNEAGNMVIRLDTMGHLENYNLPVDASHGSWMNFALRSYSTKPLWNHKISKVGVALKSVGLAFKPGNLNVSGSIEYGGTGYIKGDSDALDDFRAYQMRQWRDLGKGRLEPVDVRTVDLSIPTSAALEGSEDKYMVNNLRERPVAATLWHLVIPSSQLANIELENIEDIFVYIYSNAYQRQ